MHSLIAFVAALAAASPVLAQEAYWIANRRSNDLHQIDPGGVTLQTVSLSNNLRSAHVAPDGKVWVVRFIQSTFDIYDPTTRQTTPVANPSGNAYQIAFDAAGHAWVSGGTGVDEYDASGTYLASYALFNGSPLGITVDRLGNKWIAHRVTPAVISRIDGSTGAVTSHPVTASTMMQPVNVIADDRGSIAGQTSSVWVTGDGSGEVAQFDLQGNFQNLYPSGASSVSDVAIDLRGHVWLVSRTGSLFELDPTNGIVLNVYTLPTTDALGLAVDFRGRLWVTDRATFSCPTPPCPPCLVHRVDPATGIVEVPAEVGIGTQGQLSTRFHHARVVDPGGDLDNDMIPNDIEIQNGLSPVDAQSRLIGVATLGTSQSGAQVTVDVVTGGNDPSAVMFSATTIPSSPIGGIAGELQVGFPVVASPAVVGPWSSPLTIPIAPALVGVEVFLQGIVAPASGPAFANRTSIRIW